jgi:tetratricopeptide (TPR) repeat protein
MDSTPHHSPQQPELPLSEPKSVSTPDPKSPPPPQRQRRWLLPLFVLLLLSGGLFYLRQSGYWNQYLLLNKKTQAQTEAARLWVHYGTLQHHIGELSEALAAYEQAKTLDPALYEAWWNLSQIYDALHQFPEQLASLQQAVRCRPEAPEAWASLTKVYLQLNQDQDAMMARQQEEIAKNESIKEDELERLAFENPTVQEAWIRWGMSRAIYRFVQPLCFDSKTQEIFQKASEQLPKSPWIWAHLGLSSIKKKNEIPGSPFLTEVQISDLTSLQKAAELLPRDTTLFFLLGRAALWKGEWNTAINAFQISTQSPQAHWLAWYYLGETYLAAKRSDDAIAAYTKAQSLSPDALEIQYGVAQAYIQKGNVEEAQKILSQEGNPRSRMIPLTRRAFVQLHLHESLLAQEKENPKPAHPLPPVKPFRAQAAPREEVFTIAPDPLPVETPEPTPTIQPRTPQLPLVTDSIPPKQALSLEISPLPESSTPEIQLRHPNLTTTTEAHNPPLSLPPTEQMEKWVTQLESETLDEKTLKTIILGTEKNQRPDIALKAAQQLLRQNQSVLHWTTLGYVYGLLNKTDLEIDCYQKALRKEPNNRNALFNLGLAYLQQRRYAKSQETFQKITAIFPEDHEAWFHLGLSFEKQDRWDDGSRAYQKAVTVKPSYGEAWLNLGGIYATIKRPDLEIETYKKCLESNPNYQPAWNNLAIVLKSIGKFSEYEATKKMIEESIR